MSSLKTSLMEFRSNRLGILNFISYTFICTIFVLFLRSLCFSLKFMTKGDFYDFRIFWHAFSIMLVWLFASEDSSRRPIQYHPQSPLCLLVILSCYIYYDRDIYNVQEWTCSLTLRPSSKGRNIPLKSICSLNARCRKETFQFKINGINCLPSGEK